MLVSASAAGQFHWRRHDREVLSVRIEVWYGSYFGATASDLATFDKAIVVARVTPLHGNALPLASLPPLLHPQPIYPSVLLPPPPPNASLDQFKPRRARTPSLTSQSGLYMPSTLPTLPPLDSGLQSVNHFDCMHGLPPLPPLGELGTTPRKRRSSNASPGSGNAFDHGSGLAPLSVRPRTRSPSPLPGRRRSISSEAGQSLYSWSDESVATPGYDEMTFQAPQRAPSRNRKASQTRLQLNQLDSGAVPHIPLIFPDSLGQALPPMRPFSQIQTSYKSRKHSFIAIDDSHGIPPSRPLPSARPQTPSGTSRQLFLAPAMASHHHSPSSSPASLPLPDSFRLLSLQNSPASSRGSPSPYLHY